MSAKTILDIIHLSTDYLDKHSVASARREAEQLVADVLDVKRLDLYMQFDRPLNDDELTLCRESLKRRGQREPAQYISGKVEFFDCKLNVNPDVLIPRQETEILVDKISKNLEGVDLEGKVLWDVCCGSGCIGIALKKRFPKLNVVLSDLSINAVEVAKQNAYTNKVDVEVLHGDLLTPFKGRKADFIVSNPPYVAENEFKDLEPEVREHEPKCALVSGDTGLEIYERFANDLPQFLHPQGKVWFEMGTGQGECIKKLFESTLYRKVLVEKDWSDHDRFFFLEIE